MNKFLHEFRNHSYRFLIGVIVLISLTFNVVGGIYMTDLENQIEHRDSVINELTFNNKLVKDYFDENYDSTTHQTYYTLKNNKKTIVNHTITNTITRDHTIHEKEKEVVTITKYKEEKELAKKYNILTTEYNTLATKYNDKSEKLSQKQYALDEITKYYGINYEVNRKGEHLVINFYSNKIDSAINLFPYYKDKISLDNKKGCWIIELPKAKKEKRH